MLVSPLKCTSQEDFLWEIVNASSMESQSKEAADTT